VIIYRSSSMTTNEEERIQGVLSALLPFRIGARVRIISCDHGIKAGSISEHHDRAGLQPWMVGATGTIHLQNKRGGAEWLVMFDSPRNVTQWWVGHHQIEPL
jgi:hypothetical protein